MHPLFFTTNWRVVPYLQGGVLNALQNLWRLGLSQRKWQEQRRFHGHFGFFLQLLLLPSLASMFHLFQQSPAYHCWQTHLFSICYSQNYGPRLQQGRHCHRWKSGLNLLKNVIDGVFSPLLLKGESFCLELQTLLFTSAAKWRHRFQMFCRDCNLVVALLM